MIKLYSSNRLEWLAEKLAQDLKGNNIFTSEITIVQSRGMERWLKLEIASINGICANLTCPFPKIFIADCLKLTVGLLEIDRFAPDLLCWQVYQFLTTYKHEAEEDSFAIPFRYLAGEGRGLKAWQLAQRIAALFDAYQIFRPNSILAWSGAKERPFHDAPLEDSEHLAWQQGLWCKLRGASQESTFTEKLIELMRGLQAEQDDFSQKLPKRIHIFGISAMPPVFIAFFDMLAKFTDLHIYYLSPCKEFWQDCIKERDKLKKELKDRVLHDAEEAYWEVGNPLLASMGMAGRDFSRLVNGLEHVECDEQEFFEHDDQNGLTLLQTIQNDILRLNNPTSQVKKRSILPNDTSLSVHVCHSPMREVEVLYDQILYALKADNSLKPKDILVLTPDIETYAPYIRAVFDNPEKPALNIPYSIADKPLKRENPIAETLLSLLNLSKSRLTASEVLDILGVDAVKLAFGIESKEEIEVIRRWVVESGIRWGADADFRDKLSLPKLDANTWEFGFNRLLMGYAMPEKVGVVEGILPLDVEGSEGGVLGKLIRFFNQVRMLDSKLTSFDQDGSKRQDVGDWESFFAWLTQNFFKSTLDTEADIRQVLVVINRLLSTIKNSGITCHIHLDAIVCALKEMLADDSASAGFLHGGVTFCRMRPMRSIPARLICLLGMNEGVFPRQQKHVGFDLMAQKPISGDRNSRLDDRYLFLETLLSARERFYISYVGRNIKDNSRIPPSVLVSELVDYIKQGVELEEADVTIEDLLFVEHPLQAFSPRYFDGTNPKLQGFSVENCNAAKVIASANSNQTQKIPKESVIQSPLAAGEAIAKGEIALSQLVAFFEHPARFFIKNVLQTPLERQTILIPEDDEPFSWDDDDYFRNVEIVGDLVAGRASKQDAYFERFKCAGETPTGTFGKIQFDRHFMELNAFGDVVKAQLNGQTFKPLSIDVKLNMDVKIKGVLESHVSDNRLINYRYSKSKEKLYLKTWIEGLSLCLTNNQCNPAIIISKEGVEEMRFPELKECKAILNGLLLLYHKGMGAPLPFFPKTSMKFVQKGLEKAKEEWLPSQQENNKKGRKGCAEAKDAYNKKAFGEDWFANAAKDELDVFCKIAEQVFKPILKNVAEVKQP